MDLEKLSILLKKLREKNNYTTKQVEILSRNKVSNSYVSLIENNKRKPSADKLKILGEIYDYDYLKLYELAGYVNDIKKDILDEPLQIAGSMKNGLDLSDMSEHDKEIIRNLVESMKNKGK